MRPDLRRSSLSANRDERWAVFAPLAGAFQGPDRGVAGQRRPDQALEKLLQAAQIRPTAHLYSQIGMIYEGLGAWSRALHFLHRALEMDGGYEPTYVYLGNLYMETKHPEDAANYFREALKL